MSIRTTVIGSVALLAASTQLADAGGLARPNPVSARGVGMGGAFIAVADDPTALHFNPSGIALLPKSVILVGGEFVVAPRTYTPDRVGDTDCAVEPDFEGCRAQSPSAPVRPLPVLGYVARLQNEGVPSRVSFGVGLWNTFGGQLEYDEFQSPQIAALNSTRNAVIEVVPGVAYEISDEIAIGMAFRIGFGLFDANTTSKPTTSDLSATGFGVGATFGLMVRPTSSLNIGAVYRTSLTNQTSGSGTLTLSQSNILDVDVQVDQTWPQQAGIGVAWWATGALRLMAELDWTNWSRLDTLHVNFPGQEGFNQTFLLDWTDSIGLHGGAEYTVNDQLAVRAGVTYDTNAVPDSTIERQFFDDDKLMAAVGGSYLIAGAWRVDTAFEAGIPLGARNVPDNFDELGSWTNFGTGVGVSPQSRANSSPGKHESSLYTFELALQYLF